MRCNAGCDFCDYWKTDPANKARELGSFAEAARRFAPMMITFPGGEPLLRKDLEEIIAEVDRAAPFTYLALITHGGMLSLERAQALWDSGLDQINVSLDYLDERHDTARKIPGLTAMILSVYTDFKNGNGAHLIRGGQLARVEALTAELLAYKRRHRGVLSNSDWYIAQIPRYLRGEMTEPCRAGETTIHIDPSGHVRRCPDFPVEHHWSEHTRYEPISCNKCYYACRGEAQAPLTLSRFRDLAAKA